VSLRLEALADVVAPHIILDAIESSRRLGELGIPHALIGGVAVGLYGHVRATRDVDFLVGDEAFEKKVPILVYRRDLAEIVEAAVVNPLRGC